MVEDRCERTSARLCASEKARLRFCNAAGGDGEVRISGDTRHGAMDARGWVSRDGLRGNHDRGTESVLDPFVHLVRFSTLDRIRVAVMSLTVFPIRLILAIFMMLLAWPFAFLPYFWRNKDNAFMPFPWWLKLLDIPLKIIMRSLWFVAGFHWICVKGSPAPPQRAPIHTIAPHSTYFDAIPVTMTMSSIVAKTESQQIPLWGTLIKYVQPVFVSRDDPNSRRDTVAEIKLRAGTKGDWPTVMIFPEGTCTNRTCLIKFKAGAFIPGLPVQPVVIRYPNKMDTVSWTWCGPSALKILWLTLCQIHNRVEIEYLPVYEPSDAEKRDPNIYANNVRKVMARALGVPTVSLTLEDYFSKRRSQTEPPETERISSLLCSLRVNAERWPAIVSKLIERTKTNGEVAVGMEELARYLGLPQSVPFRELFERFDKNGEGKVDLRLVACRLHTLLKPKDLEGALRLGCQLYGESGTAGLSEKALAFALQEVVGGDAKHIASSWFEAAVTNNGHHVTFEQLCTAAGGEPGVAARLARAREAAGSSSPATACPDFSRNEKSARVYKKQD
uniref:lysophosphatidylcholine acyltransferase 1-like isoform X2 n=1 Tax=Myxine glutinosa TaxID=7769 RepID=UPI00358F8642